jgi:hypothetical protein
MVALHEPRLGFPIWAFCFDAANLCKHEQRTIREPLRLKTKDPSSFEPGLLFEFPWILITKK